jgi:hypothetical protein
MSFHVSNMSLTTAVAEAVQEVHRGLFAGPVPRFLHYYTRASTVVDIVESRSVWATCVHDQRDDKSEISHTAGLVSQLAEDISSSEIPAFAADVLRRLPFFINERRWWMFIACFCEDQGSAVHWERFGNYCLTFSAPSPGVPSLALLDPQSDCWFQRVVYDESLQRDAVEQALWAVVLAISKNTAGVNEGPWAQAMLDSCARNAAQLLLGMAAGFKRQSFQDEREWRIVCAPRLASNSSAPSSIDENFSVNVRTDKQRHVLLQIPQAHVLFHPLLIPSVPFLRWSHNPAHNDAQELDGIRNALLANHRPDLV